MTTSIITIAAVKTIVSTSPLVLFLGFGGYWVIKHRKFSEALLTVAALGGVISLIWGMILVYNMHHDGKLTGAIMMAVGLVVVVLIGLATRKQDSTNKS